MNTNNDSYERVGAIMTFQLAALDQLQAPKTRHLLQIQNPVNVKLLLSPQQSRGISHRIRATAVDTDINTCAPRTYPARNCKSNI